MRFVITKDLAVSLLTLLEILSANCDLSTASKTIQKVVLKRGSGIIASLKNTYSIRSQWLSYALDLILIGVKISIILYIFA